MAESETAPRTDFFVPDGTPREEAVARCTHIGIGAHQDDLEFMAFHGISAAFRDPERWFGGITCTDGGGSARGGKFESMSDAEMKALRAAEQRRAAEIGEYGFIAQLGFPSREIKDPAGRGRVVERIEALLRTAGAGTVYTHNPADKHPTHVAVFLAALEALRRLPPASQPEKVLGCEVWRGLDWLPDEEKVALDVSGRRELARRLNDCFESQIAGGKNYGEAVLGRRAANATFHDSHQIDSAEELWFAMDLTPLVKDPGLSPKLFVQARLRRFADSVLALL